jgi:hypothetical protein
MDVLRSGVPLPLIQAQSKLEGFKKLIHQLEEQETNNAEVNKLWTEMRKSKTYYGEPYI